MTTAELNIFVRIRAAEAQRELAKVKAQLRLLQAQTASAQATSNRPWFQSMSKDGSRLQWMGRQLMANLTAPLALAAGMSIKWGLDNEKAMKKVEKVYGDAGRDAKFYADEIKSLDKNFTALSNKYGKGKDEVTEVAAAWAAAGSSGKALAQQTELTMKTMVIGEMDAAEATKALIAIQAQYGQNTEQLTVTMEQLNAVENATGTTLEGLVTGFSRAAGVARTAGVDTKHLAAMIAALTPAAGTAAEAGNALKTIMSRLMSPTGEAADVMTEMGINLQDVSWQSMNATERLEYMAKGFENLTEPQKATASALIASRWQINKFEIAMREMASTTGYYSKALNVLADDYEVHKIAENELLTVIQSNPAKVAQAAQMIKNSMTDAFLPVIPVFVQFMQWLGKLTAAFQQIHPKTRTFILLLMGVAAALGPIILMLGLMKLAIGQLAPMFLFFGRVMLQALLLPLRPLQLLLVTYNFLVKSMILGSRVMVASIAASFARLSSFLLGFGAVQVLIARLTLLQQAVMSRASLVFTATIIRAYALMSAAITAIATSSGAILLAIQARYNALLLAGSRAYAAASAAITTASAAVHIAISTAYQAVIAALHRAHIFIMLTLTGGYWAAYNTLQAAMWRLQAIISAAGGRVVEAIQAAHEMIKLGITKAGAAAQLLVTKTYLAAITVLHATWGKIQLLFWNTLAYLIMGTWTSMFAKLIAFTRMGVSGILTAMLGMAKKLVLALVSPWGLAIGAVILLVVAFKDQIVQAFRNIVSYFQQLPAGVAQGLAPIGRMFGAIRDMIIRAFNALPESVQNALLAVVRIVKAAAMKVYELFSYFNPFAHHSPSLVENVTEGMAVVSDQFEKAAVSSKASIDSMYESMRRLGQASLNAKTTEDNAKAQDTRNQIADVTPESLPAYDQLILDVERVRREMELADQAVKNQETRMKALQDQIDSTDKQLKGMNKTLDELKKVQDAASASIDAAKESYDRFANAQISGLGAADDAIFANTMAQKKLQLQIAKMEDATGGIDSVTDAYARLQGQIETLSGKQNELRAGGAGSDILGPYEDMINGLKAQQAALGGAGDSATSGPAAKIAVLNKALEDLQKQAEIMDLEKSLKFDPLNRQIEKATSNIEEMPFNTIMAGLAGSSAQVDIFTVAYDNATAAVEAQQAAIDSVQASRDLLQDGYDLEGQKLALLTAQYDEYSQAIQDGEKALQDIAQTATDTIARIEEAKRKAEEAEKKLKDKKGEEDYVSPGLQNFRDGALGDFEQAGGNFAIGREGGLESQAGDIDAMTANLTKELEASLGGMNPFQFIIDGWNAVKNWFSTTIGPMVQPIKDMFGGIGVAVQQAFGGEGEEKISTFAQWIRNIGEWLSNAWGFVMEFAGALGRLFGPQLKDSIGEIVTAFTKMYDKVQPQLKELWDTLGPFIKTLAVIIGGSLAAIVLAIVGVISVVLEMVNGAIGPVMNFIGTVIESIIGVVNGVIQIFNGLVDILVGVGKIIVGVFTLDWDMIKEGFSNLVSGIGNILGGIWDIVWAILDSIGSLFKNGLALVWNVVYGFVKGIVDFFFWLWDVLVGHSIVPDTINAIVDWFLQLPGRILSFVWDFIQAVANFFWELPGKILDALSTLHSKLVEVFYNTFGGIISSMPGWVQGVIRFFVEFPGKVIDALGDFAELGKNVVEGFWNGIKSMGSWLTDKIKNFFTDSVPGAIRSVLEIFSPSKVTEELGSYTGEGFANGLDSQQDNVAGSAQSLANQITNITVPAVPMNDVMKEFIKSTGDAHDKLLILQNGLAAFRTETQSTEDAIAASNQVMRDTPAALEGFNQSMILASGQIDTTSAAGGKMYSQMKEVQTSFDNVGAAAFQSALDQGKSLDEAATAAFNASSSIRDSFIQQAIEAGLSAQAASDLATTYGLIPEDIFTKFNVNLDEADNDVKEFMNRQREIILAYKVQKSYRDTIDSMDPQMLEDNNNFAANVNGGRSPVQRALGGMIEGPGTGTSDSILALDRMTGMPSAWVSNGEFVVNAASTKKYLAILQAINAGTFDALAGGGVAGGGASGETSVLASALATVGSEVQAMTDSVQAVWNTFVTEMVTSQTKYSNDTKALFVGIGTVMVAEHTKMFTTIAAATALFATNQGTSFTGLSTTLLAIIAALVQKITNDYTALLTLLETRTTSTTDVVAKAFETMGKSLETTLADSITPVFDSFGPMLKALEDSFTATVNNVGTIWDGIKEKTAVPARFVINDVYNDGIRGAWNNFNSFLDLPELPTHVAKFATGGAVFGAGTATSDSIPALLSNQEHVITAAEVKGAGGHGAIEATRAYWKQGINPTEEMIARFATGGPVDSSLWQAAKTAFPNATLNSAYRPGHSGYHGKAQAVDLGGPMQEIANWIFKTYPNSAQLIWGPGPVIAEGNTDQAYARYYFRDDLAGHYDHVHWASNSPITSDGKMISMGGPTGPASAFNAAEYINSGIKSSMDAVREKMPQIGGAIAEWMPKSIDKATDELSKFLVPRAEEMMPSAGIVTSTASGPVLEQVKKAMAPYGWDQGPEFAALDQLLQHESGWNPNAQNPSSTAYGLFQFLDSTWAGVGGQKTSDPYQQAVYGARYIKDRYQTPSGAWAFWQNPQPNPYGGNWYDNGGMLGTGTQLVTNHTGGPEPILTQSQWDAMYSLAGTANTLTVEDIAQGVTQGTQDVYNGSPSSVTTDAIVQGLDSWSLQFTPAIYGAVDKAADAAASSAKSGAKTANSMEKFTEIGGKIQAGVDSLASIMNTVATAMESQEQTFATWAPVIGAVADLISQLPEVQRDWAADNPIEGETPAERKRREAANAAANYGKGLYGIFRDVAPALLKHTATIGSSIATMIAQDSAAWTAGIAALTTGNPMGAMILVPVILKEIATLLPQIIQAIVEIVPALIQAIIRFFTQFMPDSVFAYADLASAEAAVLDQINNGNIAQGQGQRYPTTNATAQAPVNAPVVVNIYGDLTMPNVTNESGAQTFANQLVMIATNS